MGGGRLAPARPRALDARAVGCVQLQAGGRPLDRDAAATMMRTTVCLAVAFWSGFFVMGVELLGSRYLAPAFGSSIYVWGALITVFMLALSLGYLAGGRWSQYRPSLPRLGLLLAAAALTALPVLPLSGALLDALFFRIPDPRFGSLTASTLLFFVPTFFSGHGVALLRAAAGAGEGIFRKERRAAVLRLDLWQCRRHHSHLVLSGQVVQDRQHPRRHDCGVDRSGRSCFTGWGKKQMKNPMRWLPLVLLFAACAAPAQQKLVHEERSLYREVLVYEGDGERCMCFTRQCRIGRQSCINLNDPKHFALNYTRLALGGMLFTGEKKPQRVLIVGLGGGTIPSALREILPDAQIDVAEIDPAVTRVAKEYFGFRTDPKLEVFEMDGRVYVKRSIREGKKYDAILLDAFDQEYIPEHLLTEEFLAGGEVTAGAGRRAGGQHLFFKQALRPRIHHLCGGVQDLLQPEDGQSRDRGAARGPAHREAAARPRAAVRAGAARLWRGHLRACCRCSPPAWTGIPRRAC